MKEKFIYEEATIEIIKFECSDVLTTSDLIEEFVSETVEGDTSGDIKLPEIEF